MTPEVLRIETAVGEATVILGHTGTVDHASPAMVWALGLPRATLLHHLAARDLCVDVVVPISAGRRGRYRLEPVAC